MKNKIINMEINFQLIKEDTQYEYLLPECLLGLCAFSELEQKCKELKERLPEDVVDVYVPTVDEVKALTVKIIACGDNWWTSTVSPCGRANVCNVTTRGYITAYPMVNDDLNGFLPFIVRKKQSIRDRDKVENIPIVCKTIGIDEHTQYECLIPELPLSRCTFRELEQKCKELKEHLPEDVVDVHVPTADEAKRLPEEIRACGTIWRTATDEYHVDEYGSVKHFFDDDDVDEVEDPDVMFVLYGSDYDAGDAYYDAYDVYVDALGGFRPIIVRRK